MVKRRGSCCHNVDAAAWHALNFIWFCKNLISTRNSCQRVATTTATSTLGSNFSMLCRRSDWKMKWMSQELSDWASEWVSKWLTDWLAGWLDLADFLQFVKGILHFVWIIAFIKIALLIFCCCRCFSSRHRLPVAAWATARFPVPNVPTPKDFVTPLLLLLLCTPRRPAVTYLETLWLHLTINFIVDLRTPYTHTHIHTHQLAGVCLWCIFSLIVNGKLGVLMFLCADI